jgi:hypothetical protein
VMLTNLGVADCNRYRSQSLGNAQDCEGTVPVKMKAPTRVAAVFLAQKEARATTWRRALTESQSHRVTSVSITVPVGNAQDCDPHSAQVVHLVSRRPNATYIILTSVLGGRYFIRMVLVCRSIAAE